MEEFDLKGSQFPKLDVDLIPTNCPDFGTTSIIHDVDYHLDALADWSYTVRVSSRNQVGTQSAQEVKVSYGYLKLLSRPGLEHGLIRDGRVEAGAKPLRPDVFTRERDCAWK